MQIYHNEEYTKQTTFIYGKSIHVPKKWKIIYVKEVTKSHKQGFYTNSKYSTNGIKLVRITDLQNPLLSYDTMPFLNLDNKIIKDFQVNKGDFLIARSGAIGRFGIVKNNIPCVFGSYIIRFVFDESLNNDFFGYLYQTEWMKKQLVMIQQGSSNININAENIKSIKFLLPPLKEQQKIATILSKVDELIQKADQIIEQTQRLKKGLMQTLLTKGIGHTKFEKTEIGEIPNSWQLVDITHIIKGKDGIKTGPFGSSLKKEIFVSKGYKIYGQENVIPDDFTIGDYFISEEVFLKMKTYEIKPGDILISLVGTHGKVSVVPDNIQKGIINPRLLRIRLDQNKVIPLYMKILLESAYIEKQIKKLTHGLTMGILNTSIIRQFYFVIPPIEEQMKIISIFFIINGKLKNLKDYKSKYEWLKKGLMQQLLTGKIRVKV